ncbi:hypothetical protein MKX01_039274 [Papaver californicum]|nr:hypothetical protein MKX01_039274 [Papaver californicum]
MAAAARELASHDHQKMISLGLQQAVESLQEMKSLGLQQVEYLGKVEALLKILVESQVKLQLQLSQTVNNAAAPNLSSSSINPLHKPAFTSTPSTLLTPKEDIITSTTATNNLAANVERPPTVNDNQEITQVINSEHNYRIETSAEDGGQLMSKHVLVEYEELRDAARKGDWKVVSKFLEKNPEAITKVIDSDAQTVLHLSMYNPNLKLIEEIVNLMPPEILEYKTTNHGYTALHYAAIFGYAKAAEMMVNKNPKLTQIVNRLGRVPLLGALISVSAGQRETVEYLYSVTRHEHPSPFSGLQGDSLLSITIDVGFYDIASSLVQRFPELVIDQTKEVQTSAMEYMAERPFASASGAKLTFLQRRIYSC